MNLLITGAAGFIGFNFLQEFVKVRKLFDKVLSFDKEGYASYHIINEYRTLCSEYDIEAVQQDINSINYHLKGDWVILNFASESHVDNSITNPLDFYLENVNIIPSLIKAIGMDNIVKFIQISTDEVYGDIPQDTPSLLWFDYDRPSPYLPNNPYSASKASQDLLLRSLSHTFNLNVQTIRLANQFGPWQHHEKMIAKSILHVLNNEPIELHGDGSNIRQWTPVVDSVKVILDVLLGNLNSPVVHIAHQHKLYTNNEVVKIWSKIISRKYNLQPDIKYITNRRGNDLMYALKTEKAVDMYFQTSLEQRFEETIDWYFTNQRRFNRDINYDSPKK